MNLSRKEEIEHKVSAIVRKYNWIVEEHPKGYKLIVTDGEADASVIIESDESIEAEAKRLIKEVDKHNFVDLN